jgi:hypothetical protein
LSTLPTGGTSTASGTYSITPSAAVPSTLTNYTYSYTAFNYVINKLSLTIPSQSGTLTWTGSSISPT